MIKKQIAALREELESRPAGLRKHIDRVRREARALARAWDLDPLRLDLAVYGHDLFRSHSDEDQLRLARESGLTIEPADREAPVLLHGPIAAAVLEDRFGVRDQDALTAVRCHTLALPEMPLIAKVVLIADKVETRKRKRTPALAPIRQLAYRDLDTALLCWADWKWVEEAENGWSHDARHWHARQRWVIEHHSERPGGFPRPALQVEIESGNPAAPTE